MTKTSHDPSEGMYPNPVALVSCGTGEEANIITLAWVGTVCGRPKMLSISVRPATHSHGLLRRYGEFVLNVPTVDQVEAARICGSKSGRDCDKWTEAGLHPDPSETIETPGIAECPVSFECRVRHTLNLGLHTLFIGEVLKVRRNPQWHLDPPPLTFIHGEYYGVDPETLGPM